jgi:hypothetical protein
VGERLLREVEDRVGIADIADDRQDVAAGCPQPGDLAVEAALLDVGHHDLHAFAQEPLGHTEPDPARRPRHDRDPPLEVLHLAPLPFPGPSGSVRLHSAPAGAGRADGAKAIPTSRPV